MINLSGFYSIKGNQSANDMLISMSRDTKQPIDDKQFRYVLSNNTGITSYPFQPARNATVVAAISGTPDWLDATLSQIASEQGPSQALIAAYQHNPDGFLQDIHGHFCFALFDIQSKVTLIGIDRIGVYSLYYYMDPEFGIVFSNSVDTLIRHPAVQCELSSQGIYNYLYFHMVPSPNSIYSKIRKLGPAQCLSFIKNKIKIREYWNPTFNEAPDTSPEDLAIELRSTLAESVTASAARASNIGCFLSGGIDSSTIVGTLSKCMQEPVKTFSIGFDAKGYDETPYARIVAKRFSCEHHEYFVTPDDVVDFVPKMAAAYAEPFGNASAIPAYFCARMAREHGIELLLAGDGGDEIFAGNERYAKQAIFEKYSIIPSAIRKNIIEPGLRITPGTNKIAPLRKLASYVAQANTPLPDRLEAYNFLHRINATNMFAHSFLEHIDTHEPLNLIRKRYNGPDSASKLNRMLYQDWKFTLADNDLRKVSHMAALAGVKVAYPLLSDQLIEFSCKVPGQLKLKKQNLRSFFKYATEDLLPKEIINKKKHGFGLPFGVWMREHKPLQELAYDSISQLKQREYFQSKFLDQAIDLHRTGHAAYYGGLIWILMVLELWIGSHPDKCGTGN